MYEPYNSLQVKNIIKDTLVKSIIDFKPEKFKPYIYSDEVKCEAVSKKAFYKLFKRMVYSAEAESVGILTLKIEETDDPRKQRYCFYDAAHVYSRLTIIVVETEDLIWIEVWPF